jgi:PadR family transcriptional regulator PadR
LIEFASTQKAAARHSSQAQIVDGNKLLGYVGLGLVETSLSLRQFYQTMKNDKQRDLFPGALEIMILRTLKRQPLHGYALVQHIKRTSNDLLQIEEGSLYPALQRLLKEELAKAEWGISSTNRRVRIYKLTAGGAKHLEREVSRFEQMLEGITRVLAPGES